MKNLMEKIYNYCATINYRVDVINIRNENYLVFESNDDAYNFMEYINSLEEYSFKTLYEVCEFLDLDYCYTDEVFYCEICEEYHFIDEGYYTTEYDIYGVECLEKNIDNFVDEFINNPEKALLNEVPELEKLGFTKANEEFDGSYLRGGKVDNPKDVLDELLLYSPNAEVVFYITYSTPYDCNYSYYYRIEEE